MDRIKAKVGGFFKAIWSLIKRVYLWIYYKLFPRYSLVVSYNQIWGDEDDREFVVKRFITKKEKYLKFVNDDGDMVEISGSDGLNYRIEQL
tara:strand:- start:1010 stop:1282 length:273 start_codon:yes stop_codon:yes gene_type:complete